MPYIPHQVHSEEVQLSDEEEWDENEASVASMDLAVPETEGSQEQSVVIRHEDFVEVDRTEDLTKKTLQDKKVTKVLIVYVPEVICLAKTFSPVKNQVLLIYCISQTVFSGHLVN